DLRRTKLKYLSQRSTFDSCSRRIKQQKINCAIDRLVVLHPVTHATADDFCVRQLRFLEIAARKARGKRTSFYTDNGRKPSRQRDCEQTNATIQIDSQCALTIVDRRVNQISEQFVIDLKETFRTEVISFSPDCPPNLWCGLIGNCHTK